MTTNPESKPAAPRSKPGWRKRLLFSSIAVVTFLAVLEGLCSFGWLVRDYHQFRDELPTAVQFREEFHTQHDPEIGWANVPGKTIPDFYGPGRAITINADGFRGLEDYVGHKPSDRFRLVCLGDSFTMGYGVGDRDTYPARLESMHSGIQVVNMGQGGYSLGQCYLWYLRDGDQLDADALLLAFILDDIWRMGEGRMANGAAAPGFEIRGGQLSVTGQPLPPPIATGEPVVEGGQTMRFFVDHCATIRTVQAIAGTEPAAQTGRQEKFKVALRIIAELQQHTEDRDIPLLIVLLPELRELTDFRAAEVYRVASEVLHSFTRDRNLPFLNLYDAFAEIGPDDVGSYFLQEHWYHYNELGNQLVARRLHPFLIDNLPGYASADRESPPEL